MDGDAVLDKVKAQLPQHLEQAMWDSTELRWIFIKVDRRIENWQDVFRCHRLRLGATPALLPTAAAQGSDAPTMPNMGVHVDVGGERQHLLPLKPVSPDRRHHLKPACFAHEVVRVCWKWPSSGSVAAPASDGEGRDVVKLRPVELPQGVTVPVAFWNLGPPRFGNEGLENLSFRYREGARTGKSRKLLIGKFSDAPNMKLLGTRAKKSTVKIHPCMVPEFRYFVGALQPGKTKMDVFEAEIWMIARAPPDAAPAPAAALAGSATGAEGVDYKALRKELVEGFGTATKKRMVDTSGSQQIHDSQAQHALAAVNEADLVSKAQLHKEDSLLEQELINMRKVLPKFDHETNQASEIYAKAIDSIAPPDLVSTEAKLDTELSERGLETVLLSPPSASQSSSDADLAHAGGSALACAVLRARAAGQINAGSKAEAKSMCKMLGALSKLVGIANLCKKNHGRATPAGLARHLGLDRNSSLVQHWYDMFFEQREGGTGTLDSQKFMCHVLVMALNMTPSHSLNLAPMWHTKEMFENWDSMQSLLHSIGCTVEVTSGPHNSLESIVAVLKAPLGTQPEGDKGKGKGKKRGRGR